MVRLGKVFGNRMVDVAATNIKLMDRALRILHDLADVDRDRGTELLQASDGSVKVALLMHTCGLDAEAAQKLLIEQNNQLRTALASCGNCIS